MTRKDFNFKKKDMGKLQSKLSSQRRQSPEGGVLASTLMNSQSEVEPILNKNMCRDMKSHNYPLKVTLPPERGLDHTNYVPASKQSKQEHTHSADRANNTFTQDPRQEWLFTLCNFDDSGKARKEDMSNLLHGVCKAIETSVRPPSESTTALKIKIVLSSSDGQHKVSQTEKKQSACEETGSPVRSLYCAGENIERRNHYLDLAGIENYTSKFDSKESTSQKPHLASQHHPVATRDNCIHPETQDFSTFNSLKRRPVRKEEISSRWHGQHPASWCQPTHFKHTVPLQRTHSKRLRPQDHISPLRPVCCHGQAGRNSDMLSTPQPFSCSPLAVRHEHHHLHEHHHHHHHHHYHAA